MRNGVRTPNDRYLKMANSSLYILYKGRKMEYQQHFWDQVKNMRDTTKRQKELSEKLITILYHVL